MSLPLRLKVLSGRFTVCRFPSGAALPSWAMEGPLSSITRTEDEVSVICAVELVPAWVQREDGWRCLKLRGPFPFSMVGILVSVLTPLAEATVGIVAISTYDTDYVLVKDTDLERALDVLAGAGHTIDP